MPRSVTLGLALSVLVAACAVLSEPVPPGTVPLQVLIANNSGQERVVSVVSGTDPTSDAIRGAVQPSGTFPANSEVNVTMYVPVTGDWAISIPGWGTIPSTDVPRTGCRYAIDIEPNPGYGGLGCMTP